MNRLTLRWLACGLAPCVYTNEGDFHPDQRGDNYYTDTKAVSGSNIALPLLEVHECIACQQGRNPNGNVGLDSAEKGELSGAVAHLPGFSELPQNAPQLPPCEIDQLEARIDQGARNN